MTKDSSKWVQYLVGVIVSLILFVAIPSIVSAVVANDKDSRQRDTDICKEVSGIKEDISRMSTSLSYIEEGIREQKDLNKEILKLLKA